MKKCRIIFLMILLLIPFKVFANDLGACENASSSLSCKYVDESTVECALSISPGNYKDISAYQGTISGATLKSISNVEGVSSGEGMEAETGNILTMLSSPTSDTKFLSLTIDNIENTSNVTISGQKITINTGDNCNLANITAAFENEAQATNTTNQQSNPHTANENVAYIGLVIVALGIVGLVILNKRKLKI